MGFETTNRLINDRIHEIASKFENNLITEREKNELAELIYPKLKFFIWKFCKNSEDTDEALQWTLKKIFKNISKFDFERGRFTTWIYAIARNETLFYLFQKKRSPIISVESIYYEYDPADKAVNGRELELEFQDVFDKTISEIYGLEDALLKNIAIDKMINREKVKSIAMKYDINENTVKTKLRKARIEIKEKVLEKNPHFKESLKHIFDL
jgi:RNA polymerase sigma-70 factor (ECF subfamily)